MFLYELVLSVILTALIHTKAPTMRFDFGKCSAHIYTMKSYDSYLFVPKCKTLLNYNSKIFLKNVLIPFKVFRTFYGLKYDTTKLKAFKGPTGTLYLRYGLY